MSRWDEEFADHAAFQALRGVREQLDRVSDQIEDATERESQARLIRVSEHAEATLLAADPELVPSGVLAQIAQSADAIVTSLQQYAEAPAAALLDQANAQADALLAQLLPVAARVTTADVQGLQEAVSSFRRAVGQHLHNIEGEVSAVRAKAQEVETLIAAQEAKAQAVDARLDSVVSEFQAQFSTGQDQRQTQFSEVLEESRTLLRTTVDEAKVTFKAAEDAATEQFAALLSSTQGETDELIAAVQARADAQHGTLTAEGKARIDQLDVLLAKAIKTVGAIGSTGMAGGYKIVADAEKKQADRWRLVAALSLLGAIGATIFAVAHGISHGFHVDSFFAKWAISVPFAALATYAARESSKHREQAIGNRKIELQLASLDTYLVSLPEEKQEEIKAKLADRFFGELPVQLTEGTGSE